MSLLVFAGLTTLFTLVTILPLTRWPIWWIQAMIFPRLQITVAGIALLGAQLVFLDMSAGPVQLMVALTIACIFYQAWWIFPYTSLHPKEVEDYSGSDGPGSDGPDSAEKIRLFTANVLGPNRNAAALIAMIRDHQPDLFVTVESNSWWEQQLECLEGRYPYTMKCPIENKYGMHVFSRLPLENAKTQYLVEKNIPSMHATVVLPSSRRIQVHFLHPAPPSPTENDTSTPRDAELLVVGRSIAGQDEPTIVAGDLNDVGWSATTRLFRKISGMLDPRIGRGMFNTFNAKHWYVRWPLDHLFHTHHFVLSFMKRLPAFGSDHFPVVVELVYDEKQGARQEGLDADPWDRARASFKIDKEDVEASDVHKPGQ